MLLLESMIKFFNTSIIYVPISQLLLSYSLMTLRQNLPPIGEVKVLLLVFLSHVIIWIFQWWVFFSDLLRLHRLLETMPRVLSPSSQAKLMMSIQYRTNLILASHRSILKNAFTRLLIWLGTTQGSVSYTERNLQERFCTTQDSTTLLNLTSVKNTYNKENSKKEEDCCNEQLGI